MTKQRSTIARTMRCQINSQSLPYGIEIRRGRGVHHLFLDWNDKPRGLKDFIAMVNPSKNVGRIVVLEVDPKRRGAGIGGKWVRWFEEYARNLGVVLIVGKVFPGTEGFWTRMGYELEEPKIAGKMFSMKRILI